MATPELYTQISDYDQLKEEVAAYINRTDGDVIEKIDLFINNAEKKIKRKLRMPSLEVMAELTTGALPDGAEKGYIRIPYDFLEMKHISYESDNSTVPLDASSINNVLETEKVGGLPLRFARSGNRFYIRPIPNEDTVFNMVYYRDLPETSTTGTSVLYTIAHDVWLYLSLAEAFRYIFEPEKAQYWSDLGEMRIEEIHEQVSESEFSGGLNVMAGGW